MDLKSIINIDVDFYNKEHMLLNAKQHDKNSRYIFVTCYNHGELCRINPYDYTAYVRYKKSDGYGVLNLCEINNDGRILVELTEQMLASDGFCYADLVIVEKGGVIVNTNTGEIIDVNNSSILSTMTFCIDVKESPIHNSNIESSYEFNALNKALAKSEANYQAVINASKSWAIGGTGTRDNEDENNAKYYAELALQNAFGSDSVVTGIKCGDDKEYRIGKVTILAESVGAIPAADIATISEVKSYLGI